jgi:hypothetical protein
MTVRSSKSAQPQIQGETNFPDGALLGLIVSRPDIRYSAQDRLVVKGGKFQTNGLSDHGRPLPPGKYNVVIVLELSNPPNVRAVIGNRGELMTGPLVKLGNIGINEFTFRAVVDVPATASPAVRPAERSDLEFVAITRCKEQVNRQNSLIAAGALDGQVARGEELKNRIRACIRTAVPEFAASAVERYNSER